MTGARAKNENAANIAIELHEKAIELLVILYRVFPASMARNDGGATLKNKKKIIQTSLNKVFLSNPKKVPKAKGKSGTPITGATKLINQLGKSGVILRKSM